MRIREACDRPTRLAALPPTKGEEVSVAQMVEDFCRQLALPQELRSSIAARTGRIAVRLNNDFRNLASDSANRFYAGSYCRGTAAPGLSDIDLICVLPYDTYAQLIAARYECLPTVLTSNLAPDEWHEAFPDNKLLGAATIDRLQHGAYTLTLEGQSHRTPRTSVASKAASKGK